MNKITLPVLCTAILLGACTPVNDNPGQVAHNYWSAISRGDHEAARKLVASNSQQDYENYIRLPADKKCLSTTSG